MANLGGEPPPFGFLPKPTDFLAEERTFLAWIRTSLGTPQHQLQRCHCLLFEYEPHVKMHEIVTECHELMAEWRRDMKAGLCEKNDRVKMHEMMTEWQRVMKA